MRIKIEAYADDVGASPRSLYWGVRRVSIVDVIDQWYGPDYRYVKVQGDDGGVYILRFDEIRKEWTLIMFVSERGQAFSQAWSLALATRAA